MLRAFIFFVLVGACSDMRFWDGLVGKEESSDDAVAASDQPEVGSSQPVNEMDKSDAVLPSPPAVSPPRLTALALASDSTCALVAGKLKCWGRGERGITGQGHTNSIGDNPQEMGDNLPAVELGTGEVVASFSGNYRHVCALLATGSLKCWGRNDDGQLGLEDSDDRGDDADEMGDNLPAINFGCGRSVKSVATGRGGAFSCAVLDDGSVKCWGNNRYGQLGQGHSDFIGDNPREMGDNLPAIDLGTGRTALSVAVGNTFVCALLDDKTVKCWGSVINGQPVGDGAGEMGDNLPTIDLKSDSLPMAIGAGVGYACVLFEDEQVSCWLTDRARAYAVEALNVGEGRKVKKLSVGGHHGCVILDNDALQCWGKNAFGQLGRGNTYDAGNINGSVDSWGNNLVTVDVGAGRVAETVVAGSYHTCAILDDDSLKCWGANYAGQLGLGHTDKLGDEENEMGDDLPALDI